MDMSYTPEEEAFRAARPHVAGGERPAGGIAGRRPRGDARVAAEAARGGAARGVVAEGVRRRRACRPWSRRSSTRSWRACAPRASSTPWPSGGSVRRSCATAPTRRSNASSRRSSTADEIWATGYSEPVVGLRHGGGEDARRARRATTTSSTARRSGPRWRTSPTGTSSSSAPRTKVEVGRAVAAADGHAEPRRRDPADPADRRRLRVQRGLHDRREGAGRRTCSARKGRAGRSCRARW